MWRQMLSDLYQCQVKTVRQSEGPALGAAILAGVGCGIYESVETACDRLIGEDKVSQPSEEAGEIYQKYHRLYQKLYTNLKDSYRELARL